MAPRPSSPTSLLWAHQLKREHGHLLKRMQDLESANEKQENRLKTAETAAKTSVNSDVASLAKEVQALGESGINERLTNMEKDVGQEIEDAQAESEAMTLQIATLQKDDMLAEEERRKTLNKDKALLKRIGELEEGLTKYENSLDRMGRKINEAQHERIKDQLESLTKQVMQEGSQMKMLTESVKALEAAHQELSNANEKLEADLRAVAERPHVVPSTSEAKSTPEDAQAEPDAIPGTESEQPKKKKSHKWGGGGADRDIIRMGSDYFDSPATTSRPSPSTIAVSKKPVFPKNPLEVKKSPVPKKASVPKKLADPSKRKKPHRWSGGGADKDIINAGTFQDRPWNQKRPSDHVVETSKKQPRKPPAIDTDKDVIRSGKGWYEVPRTPSNESQAST